MSFLAGLYQLLFSSLSRKEFEKWCNKFEKKQNQQEQDKEKGVLKKMLTVPTLFEPPPKFNEPDIYDYGVEKIVVVQRDILVDLLVKNGLHAANRSLIVAASGYPQYINQAADRILTESPEVPVFLLHDADGQGLAWAESMQQSSRFKNGRRQIIDMGMSPLDFAKIKKLSRLRLKKIDFQAPVDTLPMTMLISGIGLSLEQVVGMGDLLADSVSPDSTSSFG